MDLKLITEGASVFAVVIGLISIIWRFNGGAFKNHQLKIRSKGSGKSVEISSDTLSSKDIEKILEALSEHK